MNPRKYGDSNSGSAGGGGRDQQRGQESAAGKFQFIFILMTF